MYWNYENVDLKVSPWTLGRDLLLHFWIMSSASHLTLKLKFVTCDASQLAPSLLTKFPYTEKSISYFPYTYSNWCASTQCVFSCDFIILASHCTGWVWIVLYRLQLKRWLILYNIISFFGTNRFQIGVHGLRMWDIIKFERISVLVKKISTNEST